MGNDVVEIKIKGKSIKVSSVRINNETVVVPEKWIRMAAVQDEDWFESHVVNDPELYITGIKQKKLKADIFTFSQKLPDTQPKYKYHVEWDNVAAITITSYDEWWKNKLPQVTRKSVRRGIKRGVTAMVVEFNDDLVQGIVEIQNDTQTRQGVRFAHYGKDFDVVKREYGTFPDKNTFIGAYCENELIGIIKLVHIGKIASIMQIITKTSHYDKRPTNILIAKAVEVCVEKGMAFLVYGKYVYGNKTNNSLTEFKHRNGFEKTDLPRYYISLTVKGRIAIMLKLHLGLLGILPSSVINILRDMRTRYYQLRLRLSGQAGNEQNNNQDSKRADADGEGD